MKRLFRDIYRSVRHYGAAPRLADYAFLKPQRSGRKKGRPLVSIVTCVYNAEATLQRAMDSVRQQTYPNIEYVVVNGASTDGTADVIARNMDIVDVLLSEPDKGLYDAFNRGVAVSTGDYVAVLNGDDALAPENMAKSIAALEASGADFSFGDIEMEEEGPSGPVVRFRPADKDYAKTLNWGTTELHHPTMVAHRRIFERVGLFRTNLKITADYDWYVRLNKAGFRGVYSGVISRMKYGGVSTDRQELSILEASYVALRNGGPPLRILGFWGPLLARRIAWRIRSKLRR
jgi:glycosyltransferase